MLQVKNLNLYHKKDLRPLATELSFVLNDGDKAAIIGEEDKEENTRIRTYLGSMKYTVSEMEHTIRDLSGGQKAKLLLLKMSMEHRNVLILDEPTRNFSPLSGPVIRELLIQFPGAIISVSHDRKYIEEVCDKVYELDGRGLHPVVN